DLAAHRVLLHLADLLRDLLDHGRRHHPADLVGHLLDLRLDDVFPHSVRHLLHATLLHHAASLRRVRDLRLGTFLEGAARAVAGVADALSVNIRAADTTVDRVRDLLAFNG